jgi:hypothetical protein
MKARTTFLCLFSGLVLATAPRLASQTPGDAPPEKSESVQGRVRPDDGGPRPIIGQITAIHSGTLQIAKPDGTTAAVRLSDKTEFRKDRQPAKASEFKVGDYVLIRGQENPDHSVNAEIVAGRSGGGPNGVRLNGRGGMNGTPMGSLGKDFVAGEVKALDPPKITILRPDNVTQTIELNEETSLRRGRESITMADIQVGDHLFARGASQGDAFTPKNVTVIEPEQWKRMQEYGVMDAFQSGKTQKPQDPKPAGPNN